MSTEKEIESIYNSILTKKMYRVLGRRITFMDVLEKEGRKILGTKFRGVFPSDKIPKLNDITPYAILNLDRSGLPGSHWIAIAKVKGKPETLVYDSFGRTAKSIIPSVLTSRNGRVINTDPDAEQDIKQDDCGARSMAFLVFIDKYGAEKAKEI